MPSLKRVPALIGVFEFLSSGPKVAGLKPEAVEIPGKAHATCVATQARKESWLQLC